ncbi:ERF family protein [Sedimentibacter hydroxybenzoicus DSM 7310]|uniref:ERF family protein n=1 Tax=Sedimentibacter hydroxybenzoicus DSM 7310 TaxID=1123245 RepID=A0A974GVY5_SEDHY|nr:ERF family protein [Sedimentibacter hydroxybenzoicus]NYB73884.1 ERF family protein [Sedimentibacter hydroxybenzoicus DSM 7310]
MSIFNKLLNVQAELKAPKGQYNTFGKYKYRSCENILEAVKPLLKKEGLVLQLHDQLIKEGERFYVQAIATLVDVETTEKTSVSAFAREEETKKGMDGSQITGAASSYARKYALNGLFCIDDNSDSDITNQTGDVSNEDILKLFETATQAGYSKATIFKQIEKNYHKETPDLLTKAEYDQLLTGYKKLLKLKDGEINETE